MASKQKSKLTKEQNEAFDKIVKFIDNKEQGSPRWMTIDGKAGVGKTTVLIEVMLKYFKQGKIVAGAIAHKAKAVLCKKFEERVGRFHDSVEFHSVAGMLGMKLNEETGEFEYGYADEVPVENAKLIIIDECSMISGDQMSYILSISNPRAKILFSGDIGQLPPIGKKELELSPTFSTENIVHLHTRMRQAEDSPILPYSDYYWDSVIEGVDYVSTAPVVNIVNEHGGIYFNERQKAMEDHAAIFKKAVENGDIDTIKYICYRNMTREFMNKYLRTYIFGPNVQEYEPGDFVIFMDNWSTDASNSFKRIDNSSEHIIEYADLKKGYIDDLEVEYWSLKFTDMDCTVPVIARSSKIDFEYYLKKRFAAAFKIKDRKERKDALADVYRVKNSYAQVDHSYAITSHKSQGSTYKCVIVDKSDIMNNALVDTKTKYRSLYTAITRASKMCTIVV